MPKDWDGSLSLPKSTSLTAMKQLTSLRPHRQLLPLLLAALLSISQVHAAPGPYDETADAKTELQSSLQEVQSTGRHILVVFGANWCGDCKVLDQAFKSGHSAALIRKSFKVVKINVGRFDRNVDLAETYGVPLKKGIPAVAILAPNGKPIYVTQSGELADARSMGDTGIHDFFAKIVLTKN
jgi:thioredoxin 1